MPKSWSCKKSLIEKDSSVKLTPSTSCPSSSTKRSSEEGDEERDPVKRQRRSCGESLTEEQCSEDLTLSTSCLNSSTNTSGEVYLEVFTKRPRW